jgi:hypothetical protein
VRFTRATEAIAELGRYGFFRPKSAGARLRPLIGFTLGCSTMYRYSPPKSNIWGHSLGRMQASRQRELFAEFLKRAVAGHSFTGGSLTFFLGDAPAFFPVKARGQWGRVTSDDVRRFEQLLGTPALEGAFYSLAAHQCESALTELIQRSALLPGSMLLQGVDISRWLIEGQPVPTQSKVTLYYGMKPCISTFLQFETTGQFEFIKRVLADLAFCKLNEKHLKPIKQRSKKKSGAE